MKSFLIWLALFAVLFGGLSTGTHLLMSTDPTRIAIAIDESTGMKELWARIPEYLKSLAGRRYTEYFILSNKQRISQAWEKQLDLDIFGQTHLFLPEEYPLADLVDAGKFPELNAADKIYVFTPKTAVAEIKNRSKVVLVKL